jgi:hypothetical protein
MILNGKYHFLNENKILMKAVQKPIHTLYNIISKIIKIWQKNNNKNKIVI